MAIHEIETPKAGEYYYYISKVGKIVAKKLPPIFTHNYSGKYIETAYKNAIALWRVGNYYQTRQEAECAAQIIETAYRGGAKRNGL
ncbi:hypothetical protein FACS189499_03720 [Clostridia bacterium]|nr:hypothetical protein FACS189499_03720 [Clostridia bacterium]